MNRRSTASAEVVRPPGSVQARPIPRAAYAPRPTARDERSPSTAVIFGSHPLSTRGLREVLESDSIAVVLASTDWPHFLHVVERFRPNVAIFDLYHRDGELADRVHQVRTACCDTQVVILMDSPTMNDLRIALSAGALGFLAKGRGQSRPLSLEKIVREVGSGGAVVEAVLLAKLLRAFPFEVMQVAHRHFQVLSELDELDRNILASVARGLTARETAKQMNFTHGAVRNRLTSIYRTLGVSNRAEATAVAVRCGLTDRPTLYPYQLCVHSARPLPDDICHQHQ